MRALLDVNVLIALLDKGHIHHALGTQWLTEHLEEGWATCPITQNGCIRILSQPAYPNTMPLQQVAERLADATQDSSHQFWADNVSLLNTDHIQWKYILNTRQVTDVYLLDLAIQQGGRFVTFDKGISTTAIQQAKSHHLVKLI